MHSRKHSYCKTCFAEYSRRTRPKHRDLPPDQKARANARSKAHTYLARGKLRRSACVDCGDPASQMHHEDYSQPLQVTWLCRPCHKERHDSGEVVRGPNIDFDDAPTERPEWVSRLLAT